ncbi:fibro-slime family protein [Thioploca ingrica]|uniref:Fibro-slime family protein n=1 Tax=Thioploca ingrica TaxID=40754 RepID=A0A090ADT9_9GAMM|nr:fibro-slime family protein [Thioploca ingrica]
MKHKLLAIPLLIANVMVYAHTIELNGIIRDFPSTHPDFYGMVTGLQTGCIQKVIADGGIPIASDSVSNCAIYQLEDWYSDTHPTGFVKTYTLTLDNGQNKQGGVYQFKDNSFFPFDNEISDIKKGSYRKHHFSFDEGRDHNYQFTFEARFMFAYQAGQTLAVNGNDDIWVFINNQLVIDLGGVHTPAGAQVALQNLASTLGLVEGKVYPFALFLAQRQTVISPLSLGLGNIIPSSAGTEAGLTEMLKVNEKTCLLLGVECNRLNERAVNIWANVKLPRDKGIDELLSDRVITYQNFVDTLRDNNTLVQVLHNNVKETCSYMAQNPRVAQSSNSQQQAIDFCESGLYGRIEQMLWDGWFERSPTTAEVSQMLPFLKANFDLGHFIKTQAGNTPPVCPWDCICGHCY